MITFNFSIEKGEMFLSLSWGGFQKRYSVNISKKLETRIL
jgi:hypothetical protein